MLNRTTAYWCFTFLVCVGVCALVLSLLPIDFGSSQVLGMLLGIPVFIAAIGALLLGVAITMFKAREWPLIVMSASIVLYLGMLLIMSTLTDEQLAPLNTAFTAIGIVVALVILVLSVRWLVFERFRQSR